MSFINFKKIFDWEYWPSYMFYVPNLPYATYLAIKAKNIVFFSATNPAIKHSGNGTESKFSTIQLIPSEFRPKSVFIKAKTPIDKSLEEIKKQHIDFPLITKPDVGFRGLLVKRIHTVSDLKTYLKKHQNLNLIVQEYISYKNECGIFYHRIPNELAGKITSITLKKYLTITGNGCSSLEELILANDRAKLYFDLLKELHKNKLNEVLKKDEQKILNVIGNHSKGTQFINGNHLITPALEKAIDSIIQQIPNWYYGRFDLKYNSIEDIIALKNIKILEINGIISEPTHIYDAKNITYFKALKEIRKHWKLIYKIATKNHKLYNVKYDKISDFLASLNKLKKYTKQIKAEYKT